MYLGTDFTQAIQAGFANNDSRLVERLITDDFERVTPLWTLSKQGFWDWISAGGRGTTISDIEVIYENKDIVVCYQGVGTVDT